MSVARFCESKRRSARFGGPRGRGPTGTPGARPAEGAVRAVWRALFTTQPSDNDLRGSQTHLMLLGPVKLSVSINTRVTSSSSSSNRTCPPDSIGQRVRRTFLKGIVLLWLVVSLMVALWCPLWTVYLPGQTVMFKLHPGIPGSPLKEQGDPCS